LDEANCTNIIKGEAGEFMNIFTMVLLFFAAVGFFDKMFHLRLGLTETFDKGLMTMGSMAVSIVGIYCVSITFVQNHMEAITSMTSWLPCDPALLIGAFFAPDMGGFSITQQLISQYAYLVFYGVLLSSVLGQTLSFQFPIFLSMSNHHDHPLIMKGFLIGIIMVPFGLLIGGLLLSIPLLELFIILIPILVICLIMVLGLIIFPIVTVRILTVFAHMIQWMTYAMFLIVVVGLFFPQYAYVDYSLVSDAIVMILKMAIIVSGSMVLTDFVLKYMHKTIERLSQRLHINEKSMVGLLLSLASSLAILPLLPQMDKKGKLLNAAFGVSGAYVFGGQLAFISGVVDGFAVGVYVIGKLICGILSVMVMSMIYDHAKEGNHD